MHALLLLVKKRELYKHSSRSSLARGLLRGSGSSLIFAEVGVLCISSHAITDAIECEEWLREVLLLFAVCSLLFVCGMPRCAMPYSRVSELASMCVAEEAFWSPGCLSVLCVVCSVAEPMANHEAH